MDLGLSIFLSAIIFAILILYLSTRDRWDWCGQIKGFREKAKGRFKALIIILIACIIILLTYFTIIGLKEYFKNKPKLEKEYCGLSLDSTRDDVLFRMGTEQEMGTYSDDDNLEYYLYEFNTYLGHYLIGFYFAKGEEELQAIRVVSITETRDHSLCGVHFGSSYEFVMDHLGKPSHTIKDKEERFLYYKKLNAIYGFKTGKVISITLYDEAYEEHWLNTE